MSFIHLRCTVLHLISTCPFQAIIRQSDPSSAARLRKGEGEEEVIRGGGVSVIIEESVIETSSSENKGGPLSMNSGGGMPIKSHGSEDDPLTQLDTEDVDGFAFPSGYDKEQMSA